jgi:hypothetical protein
MKLHELVSELKKNPELEFESEIEAAFKLGEISERTQIINALNNIRYKGYCHKTSDGYTHFDWHRTISSVIHELKTGKL